MARQCLDLMVHSIHAIPKDVMAQSMQSIIQKYREFDMQALTSYTENVYHVPVSVNFPYTPYIGKSMPLLVQLLDWYSGVEENELVGKGRENDLAVRAYHLCLDVIGTLENAIYVLNNGNIKHDNLKYTVSVYLRIS